MKKETHDRFGAVEDFGEYGLACADCDEDAHEGPCLIKTCRTCGVETPASACSLHEKDGLYVKPMQRATETPNKRCPPL